MNAPGRDRRDQLIDVRECRETSTFEVRSNNGELVLTGYASTFQPYEMYGGPAQGGWIEQIDKRAFSKTLRESPDLGLLINHQGMPLARTKSGTLKLSVDSHGLKVEARLDLNDPDVQSLQTKMRRGDMDEMSFAFRVMSQTWSAADGFDDDMRSHRLITEVNLHKGDVSVVNYGANPTTHAEIQSKRRLKRMGRKTMSVAEALESEALEGPRPDTSVMDRARRLLAGGASATKTISASEAYRREEADMMETNRLGHSDASARARAIITAAGAADDGHTHGNRSAQVSSIAEMCNAPGRSFALTPPSHVLLEAAEYSERMKRHAEALEHLDRQRDAIADAVDRDVRRYR